MLTNFTPNNVLQVGNGEFAFGLDATGLQSFAGNTMAQWSWHTFPLPPGIRPEDFKLEDFDAHGRTVGYATSRKGQEVLFEWLRQNPHRLNLGRLRLLLDGKPVSANQISALNQKLELWRGEVTSQYTLAGEKVRVETVGHPDRDAVAVRIESKLIASGRLALELAFPYGDPGISGANWKRPASHTTTWHQMGEQSAQFERKLDGDDYFVRLAWNGKGELELVTPHTFILRPVGTNHFFECVCVFTPKVDFRPMPDFGSTKTEAAEHWKQFWLSGGAIDLSGSKDPRWFELERRIVLSQYLLAVNEAGSLPPQESGLFNNGWNGKFHLEMHWWHGAHYALWGRWPMFERSLGWYQRILPEAKRLAASQGYQGARWPKMVGPDGHDSPSGTGPLLIWQEPHPIFYAELDYRLHPGQNTLDRWRELVFATADFMASYPAYDKASESFVLGPPLKTVPENTIPAQTMNPAFELSYWRYGLRLAQLWRSRLGLAPNPKWEQILHQLAPLPQHDNLYLQQAGMLDTFTKMNWEHPSLIGPLGMLPGDGVDALVMKNTVRKVMDCWKWDACWGWDFPMMAMAAARNGEPSMAVDALLHSSKKNQFNALGLSTGGPFPYFPSNGGLLYAVAMMAAGWDGAPKKNAPGFPDDGSWQVKWEGLYPAP